MGVLRFLNSIKIILVIFYEISLRYASDILNYQYTDQVKKC